ncbi:hypothetical protein CALVIDRAFT_542540, partial [Calocera viscosa TUFC12733]
MMPSDTTDHGYRTGSLVAQGSFVAILGFGSHLTTWMFPYPKESGKTEEGELLL